MHIFQRREWAQSEMGEMVDDGMVSTSEIDVIDEYFWQYDWSIWSIIAANILCRNIYYLISM